MSRQKSRDLADDPAGLAAVFPAVDEAAWQRQVEEELGAPADTLVEATREGIDVAALYGAGSAPALADGVRPAVRRWRIAEEYKVADVGATAQAIRSGQRYGVELLWLHSRHRPKSIRDAVDVARLLDGVDLAARALVVETGGLGIAPAAMWTAGVKRLGLDPATLCGAFACDPLASRPLDFGEPSGDLDRRIGWLADLTAWARDEAPGMRTVLVSTAHYHDAGASAVDELALAVATAVEYLRRLTAAGPPQGLDAGDVARRTLFAVKVGSDVFVEIAKLRALRLLWAKVLRAAGVDGAPAFIHVRSSARTASKRDPRMNLLRGGAQAFAAAAGGADSLAVAPLDEALGTPREASRRLALMTQHVLADEAHLGRAADPAGGSWSIEALTDRLARAAWKLFQDLERHDGMQRCLEDGRVREIVRRSGTERYRAATHLRDPLIGVSAFVDLGLEAWEAAVEEDPAPEPEPEKPARVGEQAENSSDVERVWQELKAQDEAADALGRSLEDEDAPLGEVTRRAVEVLDCGASIFAVFYHFKDYGSFLGDGLPEGLEPCRLAEPFERLRDRSDHRLEATRARPRTFLVRVGDRGAPRAVAVRRLLAAAGIESVESEVFDPDRAVGDPGAVRAAFVEAGCEFAVLCGSDDLHPALTGALLSPLEEAGARWVMVAGRGGEHHDALRAAGIDDFLYEGCDLVTIARFLYDDLAIGGGA